MTRRSRLPMVMKPNLTKNDTVTKRFHRIRSRRFVAGLVLFFLAERGLRAEPWEAFFYGDLSLRGYETRQLVPGQDDAGISEENVATADRFGWARLALSSDLTYADRFHALLTLRARARWGAKNHSDLLEGDVAQGWIEWMNIGFSPGSLTLGRQTVGFGNGLALSDEGNEWLYDAVRGTWDAFPLVVEVVGGRTAACSRDTAVDRFYLLNVQYTMERFLAHHLEIYQGVFDRDDDARPVLFGARNVWFDLPAWMAELEGACEFGERPGGGALAAWLLDASLTYRPPVAETRFHTTARYTYASGDPDGTHEFVDLMNSDQWGRVFKPRLGNIHIFSLNNTFTLSEMWQAGLSGFYYMQDRAGVRNASRPGYESDGYAWKTDGRQRELGTEIDVFINCNVTAELAVRMHAGYFWAGSAYAAGKDAMDVRMEASLAF
ncbi:MAG: hypothetical protein EOM20_09290 [Spartobacteria bacterium]|nr:hypothetical protein [Spartobacteria bacterium]